MVHPVTGPFNEDINQATVSRQKTWYRQKQPYDLILPYSLRFGKRLKLAGWEESSPSGAMSAQSTYSGSARAQALSMAYERLKGKVSNKADIGTMLAEYPQAIRTIAKHAENLTTALKRLKKGDLPGAARALGKPLPKPRQGWRGQAADASNLVLEYSYFWAPTVKDLSEAAGILASEPEVPKGLYGTGKSPYRFYDVVNYPPWRSTYLCEGEARCKQGARFIVTNPNVVIANELGLTNPFVIAWEVIPFSFLADRVINIKQLLSLGTDYLGLAILDSYTTQVQSGIVKNTTYHASGWLGYFSDGEYEGVRMDRTLGLSTPSLTVKPYRIPKWGEALTWMSLLAQQLRPR